ncbi:hypothetical protein OH76DRAFT_639461 [Lentinus brumalis]|uniref:Uncharacterized protein n=1 Tax=Lentinus brumalis TaxID=2498619 RepID=A0A371D7Q1_9APHY|nr:hypothetical protein OH76DRAFT_639461 [Polyporus brumalis]
MPPNANKNTRFRLTSVAEQLRQDAFANGKVLTKAEKLSLFETLQAMPGCDQYTKKAHDNWCRNHESQRTAHARGFIEQALHDLPNVAMVTLWHIACWARICGVTFQAATDIVWDLVEGDIVFAAQQMAEQGF